MMKSRDELWNVIPVTFSLVKNRIKVENENFFDSVKKNDVDMRMQKNINHWHNLNKNVIKFIYHYSFWLCKSECS